MSVTSDRGLLASPCRAIGQTLLHRGRTLCLQRALPGPQHPPHANSSPETAYRFAGGICCVAPPVCRDPNDPPSSPIACPGGGIWKWPVTHNEKISAPPNITTGGGTKGQQRRFVNRVVRAFNRRTFLISPDLSGSGVRNSSHLAFDDRAFRKYSAVMFTTAIAKDHRTSEKSMDRPQDWPPRPHCDDNSRKGHREQRSSLVLPSPKQIGPRFAAAGVSRTS